MRNILFFLGISSMAIESFIVAANPVTPPIVKESQKSDVELTHYLSSDKKYSIDYPATWEKKDVLKELDIMVLAPLETPQDDFRQNVSVISGKMHDPVTLQDFFNGNITNLAATLSQFKPEGEGLSTIDGIPARWIIYSHRIENLDLKVLQYFLVTGDHVYVITCTAEPAKFDRYREAFEHMANSFKKNNGNQK